MPKNLFQDMVRVKRMEKEKAEQARSPRPKRIPREEEAPREAREDERIEVATSPRTKFGGGRRMLWLVALVAVVFFVFALSFLFARAEVKINPKIKSLNLSENLTAVKEGNGSDLAYDVVIISGEEKKTVTATGEKNVSIKAEGVAVLYNTFSSSPQNLSIDTRLEGSNGKMYKTQTKVTVPGMKGNVPGSIEVKIYANEAGKEYNSDPIDFKIFGFKGTPKYTKFYGRSKGPITGGVVGTVPALPEGEEEKLSLELKDALRAKLLGQATEQIPAGFILFKDSAFLSVEGQTYDSSGQTGSVVASMRGTLSGILFDEKKLTEKIVKDNIKSYDGGEVYIPHLKDLAFSLPSASVSNLSSLTQLGFTLSGPAQVVSKVDGDQLVADLVGKSKGSFNEILAEYPEVDSAESVISPFWKRSFPESRKKIKIVVNYPE
jgi:hypothetical protein